MSDFLTRFATLPEARDIAAMWCQIDALIDQPAFGGFVGSSLEYHQHLIEQTIKASTGETWVTTTEGKLIGTISVRCFERSQLQQSRQAVIYGLWVEPDYRHQKVATYLLDTVRNYCLQQSVQALQVAWDSSNQAAEAFWRKQGFAPYEVIASQTL